jgi:hypothetical protein
MLRLLVALVLGASALIGGGRPARADTVSLTIRPGPFLVSLDATSGEVVLMVDDSTGSGAGWWVTVDCTCQTRPLGAPIAVIGQTIDATAGPRLTGRTLVAAPGHGMGVYRLAFAVAPGEWTMTSGRGAIPAPA